MEFRWLDYDKVGNAMATRAIVDARNLLEPAMLRRLGFTYKGIGDRVSRVLVTGGAGFVGSHLCEALVARGDEVVCVEDLSSGLEANLAGLLEHDSFSFVRADLCDGLDVDGGLDTVLHLASPASPRDCLGRPLETLAAGSRGPRRRSSSPIATTPASSSPRRARSTANRWCTPRARTTGGTSTRSGPAASMTRQSVSPKR